MRSFTRFLSLLLCLIVVVGLLPGFTSALSISDSSFTKIGSIPNDYVATQGMCTDGKYIYTFKMISGNNNQARFYRTSISTGETVLMRATFDTSLTNFLALGHGNDMCAVVHKGVTYLYLATMYNRSHSEFSTHSIWKFKVTGSNLEKVAYYDVIEFGTDDMDFTGLTVYKQTDTHVTLMSADGKYVYTIELGLDQPSGTVDCQWAFTINYMTAPTPTGAPTFRFKDSNGNSYYGVQGMTYDNGKLYYVLTGSQTTATAKDNYIFCYDIENIPNTKSVEAIASESIYVTSSYYQFFLEFESIDIHNGVMYFSANAGKYGYYEDYDFCGKLKKTFATTPQYTVTFCDEAGTTLQSVKVKKGDTAKYTAATPTKTYDDANHYTFKEWLTAVGGSSATLTNVQGDMKVYAGFTATAHSYTEKITAQSSCTIEGSKTLTCSCGRSYTESMAVTDHTPTVINDKEATCSATGYTGDTVCSVCHATLSTGTVIEALPHTPLADKGYAATCTATGLSDGSHCSICGEILKAQTVLPFAPHKEQSIPGKEPGCLTSGLSEGIVCADCGAMVKQQEVLPRLGHSYTYVNNGETHAGTCSRCSKTTTAAHNYAEGNCICGATLTPEATVDETIVIQHSLNLASDISINFAVEKALLEGFDMESVYMKTEVPLYKGNVQVGTDTITLYPVDKGSYYYFTLEGLTAVHMNDKLSSVLHGTKDDQPYCSPADEYSIAEYAYSQLDKNGGSEGLKLLCADLLRYGASAQIFKGYRTDALADAAMTDTHKSYLSDMEAVTFGNTNVMLNDLADPTITWAGKILNLESKVALKFVFSTTNFSGNLEDLNLRVTYTNIEGETITTTVHEVASYNAALQQYAFSFGGLLAAELRSVVSVQVYEKDTPVSCTLQYSADTYGNNKTGTLLTLCKALFAYSDSAETYFTN